MYMHIYIYIVRILFTYIYIYVCVYIYRYTPHGTSCFGGRQLQGRAWPQPESSTSGAHWIGGGGLSYTSFSRRHHWEYTSSFGSGPPEAPNPLKPCGGLGDLFCFCELFNYRHRATDLGAVILHAGPLLQLQSRESLGS